MDYKTFAEYQDAVNSGVDAESVVSKVASGTGYKRLVSDGPKERLIKTALIQAVKDLGDANHEPFNEDIILFGCYDQANSKAPIKLIGVRAKENGGALVSITTWDKKQIPALPCKCRVEGLISTIDGHVLLTKTGGISNAQSVDEQLVYKTALSRAVENTDNRKIGTWEGPTKTTTGTVVALKGKIGGVRKVPFFEGKELKGELEFYESTDEKTPRKLPCFDAQLGFIEGGYTCSLVLGRQKFGHPTIRVDDLEVMAENDIMEGLVGAEVVGVGIVSSMNPSEKSSTTYVRVECAYIAEVKEDVHATIEPEPVKEEPAPKKQPAKKKAVQEPVPKSPKEEEYAEEVADDETQLPEEKLFEDIMLMAKTGGIDARQIPIDKIKKACTVPDWFDDSKISVIRKAVWVKMMEEKGLE